MARDTIPPPTAEHVALCRASLATQAQAHGVDTTDHNVAAFVASHALVLAQLQREVSHLQSFLHPRGTQDD